MVATEFSISNVGGVIQMKTKLIRIQMITRWTQ
jgi:hypothetical protein